MKQNKNHARRDFIEIVLRSWTWAKLDAGERNACLCALQSAIISGTYWQRRDTLRSVYYGFLLALGYKATGWRDDHGAELAEEAPQF